MAKFSQEFLRQAASPMGSVQGGLLSAVGGAATLPQQLQERQKAQAMQAEMAKYTPGSPEYNAALARQQVGKGMFTEAAATGASAIRGQQEAEQAAAEKERRGRLMSAAMKKAARSDDPSGNSARVRNMTSEQLMEYLKPKEKKDPIQLVTGARLVDPNTNKVLVEARDAPPRQVNVAYELFKTGKYDPTSFKYDDNGNLLGDLSSVKLAKGPRGGVPPNVEKRMIDMDADSAKSTIQFGRARKLKEDLIASPGKSRGAVSSLRTQVLDFAGLRDAEEEKKTDFIRTRNTDIINSLPPGVASDTDVRIFSAGFPSENARSEEIIRYLEAEERILAAQSDMSALFQQHVNKLVEDGIEATTAGFEEERRKYANIMTAFREKVEFATNEQGQPLYTEEQKRRYLQEALGFVPTYYSR